MVSSSIMLYFFLPATVVESETSLGNLGPLNPCVISLVVASYLAYDGCKRA